MTINVSGMVDHGVQLREFVLEHPAPAKINVLYEKLEILDPPRVVEGPRARYFATIETPRGLRRLH